MQIWCLASDIEANVKSTTLISASSRATMPLLAADRKDTG
jgi:hypothetical protein